jgi:hypothetical protein
MFLNSSQQSALAASADYLEKFGSPSVYNNGGDLRIKLKKTQKSADSFRNE